jgi:hypothetical protein
MEELHDHRIIPLDGRPHVGSNILSWLGDSRGRWESQTLVVETTNFNDRMLFGGATSQLRLIERFTRRDGPPFSFALIAVTAVMFPPTLLPTTARRPPSTLISSPCSATHFVAA